MKEYKKEPTFYAGDKIWIEGEIACFEGTHVIGIKIPFNDPLVWIYKDDKHVVASTLQRSLSDSLDAATKQRDIYKAALRECRSHSIFGNPPDYKSALLDLMTIAGEALNKFDGDL